jgi:hypothetical protein
MRLHNNSVLYQGQLLATASTGTLTVTPARTILLYFPTVISLAPRYYTQEGMHEEGRTKQNRWDFDNKITYGITIPSHGGISNTLKPFLPIEIKSMEKWSVKDYSINLKK